MRLHAEHIHKLLRDVPNYSPGGLYPPLGVFSPLLGSLFSQKSLKTVKTPIFLTGTYYFHPLVADENGRCAKSWVLVQTTFLPSFVKIFHDIGHPSCEELTKTVKTPILPTFVLNSSTPGWRIKKTATIKVVYWSNLHSYQVLSNYSII